MLDAVLLAKYSGISEDLDNQHVVISQLVEQRYRIRVAEILQCIEPIIVNRTLDEKGREIY